MSEEIVLPSLDDAAKQRIEETLRKRMEKQGHVTFSDIKGKEPEPPKEESETMKKLRIISERRTSMAMSAIQQSIQDNAPRPVEPTGVPPCVKIVLGAVVAIGVAYYLGNKTYKYYQSANLPDPE